MLCLIQLNLRLFYLENVGNLQDVKYYIDIKTLFHRTISRYFSILEDDQIFYSLQKAPFCIIKKHRLMVAAWLTRRTSNQRIASCMGSGPVRDKRFFPWARNFTLLAQYWLVPVPVPECFFKLEAFFRIKLKKFSIN